MHSSFPTSTPLPTSVHGTNLMSAPLSASVPTFSDMALAADPVASACQMGAPVRHVLMRGLRIKVGAGGGVWGGGGGGRVGVVRWGTGPAFGGMQIRWLHAHPQFLSPLC